MRNAHALLGRWGRADPGLGRIRPPWRPYTKDWRRPTDADGMVWGSVERGAAKDRHEWRKRVKYGWYHMRLLTDASPAILSPLEERLHDLSDALGGDHDLARRWPPIPSGSSWDGSTSYKTGHSAWLGACTPEKVQARRPHPRICGGVARSRRGTGGRWVGAPLGGRRRPGKPISGRRVESERRRNPGSRDRALHRASRRA